MSVLTASRVLLIFDLLLATAIIWAVEHIAEHFVSISIADVCGAAGGSFYLALGSSVKHHFAHGVTRAIEGNVLILGAAIAFVLYFATWVPQTIPWVIGRAFGGFVFWFAMVLLTDEVQKAAAQSCPAAATGQCPFSKPIGSAPSSATEGPVESALSMSATKC